MDTQEKSSEVLQGDYGYIKYTKKKNLKTAALLLVSCIFVFFIGTMFFKQVEIIFMVVSMLLILPASQFAARYVSFRGYGYLKLEQYRNLENISDNFLVLGELPLIRGKKVYLVMVTVITEVGIYALIEKQRSKSISQKKCRGTAALIDEIVRPKGYTMGVEVYDDYDEFEAKLRTQIKSKAQNVERSILLEKTAASIIQTAH